MGSFPVTSVAREAVRHDQREAQAPREVGYSSQRGDPQANPQLKQDLSRAPVRAARLKAPRVPIGVHIANTGLQAARFADVPNGLRTIKPLLRAAAGIIYIACWPVPGREARSAAPLLSRTCVRNFVRPVRSVSSVSACCGFLALDADWHETSLRSPAVCRSSDACRASLWRKNLSVEQRSESL